MKKWDEEKDQDDARKFNKNIINNTTTKDRLTLSTPKGGRFLIHRSELAHTRWFE